MLAGAAVKEKYPEIKYYPYFLDSLSGGYGPRIFSDKKTINAGIKIEKKVFKIADSIVLMESSRIHQMKYNSEFSEKFNFLDVPMFVPCEKNKVNSEKKDYKKLLYIGSIPVAIRNPDPLIKMLAEISDENVECEFIGNIDCPERFSDLKEKFGDKLEFTGYISHDRIADKINSADVLLNIGNSNNSMVPSKIFEYMSYGKPIISTYVIDDEPSLKYLKKYPCALMVDGRNNDSIKEKVLDFIWNSEDVDSFELVENFYTNTPKAFLNEIIKI